MLTCPVAFNERAKIGRVIDRLQAANLPHVALGDDGSDDGTTELARERGVELVRHEQRRGVGAMIRTVIGHAREAGYDVLVIMAGNDKDEPAQAQRLVAPIARGEADIVQGSRYLPGGEFGNMPLYRQLSTRLIHPLLFSLLARKRMTDTTNGFRAIRLSIFDDPRLAIDQPWLDQYELEVYLLFKALRLGYRVIEAPVSKIYPEHDLGYTKMRPLSGWWSILRPLFLLGLGIRK
ncbi:MAG: glycosyltransferase family 2 protein [Candidatus Alcyoniella australis]|nr:glycosyltransferase family 2 protein [Candidatus Alcyoniella australis]